MFTRILAVIFIQAAILYLVFPEVNASDIDAQGLYEKHCTTCHGEDGKGETPLGEGLGAKDISEKEFQDSITDEQIIKQITNGTEEKMFPFKSKLTPDEIQALAPVIRAFGK